MKQLHGELETSGEWTSRRERFRYEDGPILLGTSLGGFLETVMVDVAAMDTVTRIWKSALRAEYIGIVSPADVRTRLQECFVRFSSDDPQQ